MSTSDTDQRQWSGGGAMQPRFLEKRVEILEQSVTELERLPARFDAFAQQFLQHREESRAAFSALTAADDAIRSDLQAFQNRVEKEFVQVRKEIREGDDDTRLQMRILHDEAISRISLLGEGQARTEDHLEKHSGIG